MARAFSDDLRERVEEINESTVLETILDQLPSSQRVIIWAFYTHQTSSDSREGWHNASPQSRRYANFIDRQ